MICFSPKAPIQLVRPKSYLAPPGAFEHNLCQNMPIKRLFQPKLGLFQPLGPNQPWVIGLHWPWFKGAKWESKIELYFTYWKGPIFRAKQIFLIYSLIFLFKILSYNENCSNRNKKQQ